MTFDGYIGDGAIVSDASVSHQWDSIVVIELRNIVMECVASCLQARWPSGRIAAFASVIDWMASISDDDDGDVLIMLGIGGRRASDDLVMNAVAQLREAAPGCRIVLMGDEEDAPQILEALDLGACGYVPTSVSLSVAVEAMKLVAVGGTYIPASSLTSSRKLICEGAHVNPLVTAGRFTARQAAVVDALRQGKANKIIAYELNMRESTVKVHVRNIMRKLKAKNRTEVAFMTSAQPQPSAPC